MPSRLFVAGAQLQLVALLWFCPSGEAAGWHLEAVFLQRLKATAQAQSQARRCSGLYAGWLDSVGKASLLVGLLKAAGCGTNTAGRVA